MRDPEQPMTEQDVLKEIKRRTFFKQVGYGIGGLALAQLAAETGFALSPEQHIPKPHFAPKAKNVIYLFMAGAPSQVDLFDPKPTLNKFN